MTDTSSEDTGGTQRAADAAALELIKQVIGLSAGVLALSATFLEKLKPQGWPVGILLASWVILLVALVAGLQTISAIVKSRLNQDDSWSEGYGRFAARVSKYGFVIGMVLFVAFAFISLTSCPSQGAAAPRVIQGGSNQE